MSTSGSLSSSLGDKGSASNTLVVNASTVPTLGSTGLLPLAMLLSVLPYWHLRQRGRA